jgi:hypothetical protein
MAHFAGLDNLNNVIAVVVIRDSDVENANQVLEGLALEDTQLESVAYWLQTSYNTRHNKHTAKGKALRGNFAGAGYTYDSKADKFIPPKPFPSWILNTKIYDWAAPSPMPEDGEAYYWDESGKSWTND